MRRKIEFEEFIDALVEANNKIKAASTLDDQVQRQEQRATALTAQIEILNKESDNLSHAIKDHKKAIDEHIARERANADTDVAAYRASKESEKQAIAETVAAAKRDADASIAGFQTQESAAKQAAAVAKSELAAINEALDKSRNELAKAAKYANMARA